MSQIYPEFLDTGGITQRAMLNSSNQLPERESSEADMNSEGDLALGRVINDRLSIEKKQKQVAVENQMTGNIDQSPSPLLNRKNKIMTSNSPPMRENSQQNLAQMPSRPPKIALISTALQTSMLSRESSQAIQTRRRKSSVNGRPGQSEQLRQKLKTEDNNTPNKLQLKFIMLVKNKLQTLQLFFHKSESYRYKRLTANMFTFFNDRTVRASEILHKQQYGGKRVGANQSNPYERSATQQEGIARNQYTPSCLRNLRFPVFMPHQKLLWDFVKFFTILFGFEIIPFNIVYCDLMDLNVLFIAWALPVLLIDMLISINTAFYQRGQLIMERAQIFRTYVDDKLRSDLLTVAPLIYHLFLNESNKGWEDSTSPLFYQNLPLMLFYLTFSSFKRMKNKLQDAFQASAAFSYLYEFLILITIVITYTHISACMWVYVARMERATGLTTWTDKRNNGDPISIRDYWDGLYFSTITMTTVGYGDIVPVNPTEVKISIAFTLVSSIMFAFALNRVGSIIDRYYSQNQEKEDLMIQVNKYLGDKQITRDLQFAIRDYIEFYYEQDMNSKKKAEQRIFAILSDSLKQRLLLNSFKIALQDSPIFRRNFSEDIIEKTISLVQELHYNPEQIIFRRGEEVDAIYFVLEGQFDIFVCDDQGERTSIVYTLQKGDVFGEIEFFTGQSRSQCVRSRAFSSCLKILRRDFLNIFKTAKNPEDYEKFCHIRDQILFSNQHAEIDARCYACRSVLHAAQMCPFVTYQPHRFKCIQQLMSSHSHMERNSGFKRRQKISNANNKYLLRTIRDQPILQDIIVAMHTKDEMLQDCLYTWLIEHYKDEENFPEEFYYSDEEDSHISNSSSGSSSGSGSSSSDSDNDSDSSSSSSDKTSIEQQKNMQQKQMQETYDRLHEKHERTITEDSDDSDDSSSNKSAKKSNKPKHSSPPLPVKNTTQAVSNQQQDINKDSANEEELKTNNYQKTQEHKSNLLENVKRQGHRLKRSESHLIVPGTSVFSEAAENHHKNFSNLLPPIFAKSTGMSTALKPSCVQSQSLAGSPLSQNSPINRHTENSPNLTGISSVQLQKQHQQQQQQQQASQHNLPPAPQAQLRLGPIRRQSLVFDNKKMFQGLLQKQQNTTTLKTEELGKSVTRKTNPIEQNLPLLIQQLMTQHANQYKIASQNLLPIGNEPFFNQQDKRTSMPLQPPILPDQQKILLELDSMKRYTVYFPFGNYSVILKNYNKIVAINMEKRVPQKKNILQQAARKSLMHKLPNFLNLQQ